MPKQGDPMTMHKDLMDRFFLLKTQRAPTMPIEISSFKEVLSRNFSFGGCQAKKQAFGGAFDLQMATEGKSKKLDRS